MRVSEYKQAIKALENELLEQKSRNSKLQKMLLGKH